MFSRAPDEGIGPGAVQQAEHGGGNEAARAAGRRPRAIDRFQQGDQIAFDLQPAVAIGVAELEVRIPQQLPEGGTVAQAECGPPAVRPTRQSLRRSITPATATDCRSPARCGAPAAVRRRTPEGRGRLRWERNGPWPPLARAAPRAAACRHLEDRWETWETPPSQGNAEPKSQSTSIWPYCTPPGRRGKPPCDEFWEATPDAERAAR